MSDISRNNFWNYICSIINSMRFFILIFLFGSYTYSQVESSNRKIELPPPAKKTLIPPVSKQNPNSFTILKNPTNPQKSVMEQDTEYFAEPGKKFLKRLKTNYTNRVSLYYYNSKDEIDFFIVSLNKVIKILKK